MDNAYYIFNLLVFLPVFLLSLFTDVKPHKNIKALLFAYLIVSLPFVVWDFWAASEGHWGFNSKYISGPYLFSVPFEEILFFITVPFAMMYVWGVVQKHLKIKQINKKYYLSILFFIALLSLALLIIGWGNGYSISAALAALITVIVLLKSSLINTNQFWAFQIVLLALFIICNTILTALPIITYGPDAIIGFRLGTIPVEDFFFNFALINLFLVAYHHVVNRSNILTK
jgi:lycopene cyclase domain-containing protein